MRRHSAEPIDGNPWPKPADCRASRQQCKMTAAPNNDGIGQWQYKWFKSQLHMSKVTTIGSRGSRKQKGANKRRKQQEETHRTSASNATRHVTSFFLSLLFPDQTYFNILFSGNNCEWLKMDRDVRWCSYCFYLCFLSDKIYSYILFLGNMFSVSGIFTNHKQQKTEKYTNVLGFECRWSVFPGTSQIWYS